MPFHRKGNEAMIGMELSVNIPSLMHPVELEQMVKFALPGTRFVVYASP